MASSQALVLRFNADTAPARRAFTELAQTGAVQMAALAGAAAASGRKIDSGLLGTLAKLAAGITGAQLAYAAFAAVAASSIGVAIERLGEYRKVLADANAVGVSTDFFQKFTQSTGEAADKIKQLQEGLRNARAATREGFDGSAIGSQLQVLFENGALGAAGEAARNAFKSAQSTEERVAATIRAIDDLRARGNDLLALDLAEKLFGQAAADALIERANRTGQSLTEMVNTTADKKVVSPEQIENARKLEERLEAARKTMSEGMRPILEDLERLGTAIYRGWVNTEEAIARAVKTAGALYVAARNVANALSVDVGDGTNPAEVTAFLEKKLADAQKRGLSGAALEPLQKRVDAARAFQGRDQLARDAIPAVELPTQRPLVPTADSAVQAFNETQKERQRVQGRQRNASVPSAGSAASSDSDLEFYERYVANIEKATAALKTEIETLGLSTYEREKATLSSKAYAEFKAKDIELSDEQRAKVDQLIDAQARLKAQLEATKEAQQAQRELLQFFGTNVSSFFSDMVSGGKNAEQALMNVTKRLADAAFQAVLLGQGPLAKIFGFAGENGNVGGLLGGLFGGGSGGAGGFFGSLFGGASFDVGSQSVPRDMFARVHAGERILTKADAQRQDRSAGSQPVIINQSFDLRGADTSTQMVALIKQQAAEEAVRAVEAKRAARPAYLA